MGPNARWKQPALVTSFFENICKELENKLDGATVELIIEKERRQAGVIYNTMFKAAFEADVFIADLTGANPNVFLELGVRYALRRGITLLVSQGEEKPPFNVEHLRVIRYADGPDAIATTKIIEFIKNGLEQEDYNDSPVLEVMDLQTVTRSLWDKVSGKRIQELMEAAEAAEAACSSTSQITHFLRQALEIDPLNVVTRLKLAGHLRKQEHFTEALDVLDEGLAISRKNSALYQERGILLGRMPGPTNLEQAVDSLRRSVEFSSNNADALASLGGALRRLALSQTAQARRDALLHDSAKQYLAALELNRYDTYPALNLVRLGYLLSNSSHSDLSWDNSAMLEKTFHLCAFETVDSPDDYWRALDLADTMLFKGMDQECKQQYQRSISMIPNYLKRTVLQSPLATLREQLDMQAIPAHAQQTASDLVDFLNQEITSLVQSPLSEPFHGSPR